MAKDQTALRLRTRDLAASRPRYGYNRIWVLLRREWWCPHKKRARRLYQHDGLQFRMRMRRRKQMELHRGPAPVPQRRRERRSMDFVHDALADGRTDVSGTHSGGSVESRESDPSSGREHDGPGRGRGPASRDWRGESAGVHHRRSRHRLDIACTGRLGVGTVVQFDFIRPAKPVENTYVESFNGKLRDACLHTHQFRTPDNAKASIEA